MQEERDALAVKINLKMIESAGYQHLYGIAPVLNALKANVRDFTNIPTEDGEENDKETTEDLLELQSRLANVDGIDDDGDEFTNAFEEEYDYSNNNKKKANLIIKPEAALSPHLFIQSGSLDNSKRSFRSTAKKDAINEIITLAKEQQEMELPIVEVDKGVLNTLCGNRPHQGFVLRCGSLDFEPVNKLPVPVPVVTVADNNNEDYDGKKTIMGPSLWLALDEVVDPQNLGALLRSAYFLGSGPGIISDDDINDAVIGGKVGILVCSKNSSPLTPTVSAASAGALEFMTIYSTSNLPKLLNGAKEDGWRILGAAAEVPDGGANSKDGQYGGGGSSSKSIGNNNDNEWDLGGMEEEDEDAEDEVMDFIAATEDVTQQQCFDLHKVETGSPTILVLGSEGRGLRTLVARACTGFVSVPGGGGFAGNTNIEDETTQAGVDSLNVSVTGGILLWHFLSK
ncbi:hypothetical protein ACHAXR_007552 [Thalassiosira sp. AJA248-18]